jgi:hypothetical protein
MLHPVLDDPASELVDLVLVWTAGLAATVVVRCV